jgi:hypothetical protein
MINGTVLLGCSCLVIKLPESKRDSWRYLAFECYFNFSFILCQCVNNLLTYLH